MAAVAQVYGSLDQITQVVEDSGLVQPGAILTSLSSDQAPSGVRDLAWLQAPAGLAQPEWLSRDELLDLGQAARRGQPVLLAGLLDDEALRAEVDDLAGLEAFFAGAAAKGGQSRGP